MSNDTSGTSFLLGAITGAGLCTMMTLTLGFRVPSDEVVQPLTDAGVEASSCSEDLADKSETLDKCHEMLNKCAKVCSAKGEKK